MGTRDKIIIDLFLCVFFGVPICIKSLYISFDELVQGEPDSMTDFWMLIGLDNEVHHYQEDQHESLCWWVKKGGSFCVYILISST
jgi:hypothetical protein